MTRRQANYRAVRYGAFSLHSIDAILLQSSPIHIVHRWLLRRDYESPLDYKVLQMVEQRISLLQ